MICLEGTVYLESFALIFNFSNQVRKSIELSMQCVEQCGNFTSSIYILLSFFCEWMIERDFDSLKIFKIPFISYAEERT